MFAPALESSMSYSERIESLRTAKRAQTLGKRSVRGTMDFDVHGIIVPPDGTYKIVHSMSRSGIEITDAVMTAFPPSRFRCIGLMMGFTGLYLSQEPMLPAAIMRGELSRNRRSGSERRG